MKNIPSSIEAEESLLGAMLQNSSAIAIAMSKVRVGDFYSERNKLFFQAIITMNERGIDVNAETALLYIKENGLFDNIVQNDEEYILRIIDGSTFPQNANYYCEIIKEKSLLRELIKATQEIQKDAFEANDEEAKNVADLAEKRIFEVTQRRLSNDFVQIKEILYEVLSNIEKRSGNKNLGTGVPSGFTGIDKITNGFQPSDLIILAARPSVGKTSFALNIIENVMTNTNSMNYGIGFFSLEMSKLQIVERLLASKSRISLSRIRSGDLDRNKNEWHTLGAALERLYQGNLLIDDSSGTSIMELRGKARQMKYKFAELSKATKKDVDLKLIVVDYLQLIAGTYQQKRSGSREQEVAEVSRGLKALAKELNVPVIALAQLSRASENRTDERPRLSDLRESGSIEQDADIVMFLHRKKSENADDELVNERQKEVDIIIAKHRNGAILDRLPLTFITDQTRFENKKEID